MTIAAILLATEDVAVNGTPVALLPWRDDETLIEYQVDQLQAAGVDVVVVVLGCEAERVIPAVARDNVEPIVNDRWEEGSAGSVRVGAAAIPRDSDAAIVVRVEEWAAEGVYRQLIDQLRDNGATLAAVGGGANTPVAVAASLLGELRNITDGSGLGAMLARHTPELHVVAAGGVARIEDAASYASARATAGLG